MGCFDSRRPWVVQDFLSLIEWSLDGCDLIWVNIQWIKSRWNFDELRWKLRESWMSTILFNIRKYVEFSSILKGGYLGVFTSFCTSIWSCGLQSCVLFLVDFRCELNVSWISTILFEIVHWIWIHLRGIETMYLDVVAIVFIFAS